MWSGQPSRSSLSGGVSAARPHLVLRGDPAGGGRAAGGGSGYGSYGSAPHTSGFVVGGDAPTHVGSAPGGFGGYGAGSYPTHVGSAPSGMGHLMAPTGAGSLLPSHLDLMSDIDSCLQSEAELQGGGEMDFDLSLGDSAGQGGMLLSPHSETDAWSPPPSPAPVLPPFGDPTVESLRRQMDTTLTHNSH
jgi:hypothetical protein